MNTQRKIIAFLVFVLLVVGLLFVWWRTLLKDEEGAPAQGGKGVDAPAPTSSAPSGFAPPPSAGGLFAEPSGGGGAATSSRTPGSGSVLEEFSFSRISDQPAFAHWVIGGTGEAFYLTSSGKVFLAEEGDDIEISSQELPSPLVRALPSASGRLVLGTFGTPEFPRWGVYDSVDSVWRPLPSGIQDAVWGADEDTLVVRMERDSLFSLGTINLGADGFPFKEIIPDFRLKGVAMHALGSSRLLLVEKLLSGSASRVWELNTSTLSLRLLSSIEEGVLVRVSPNRSITLRYAEPLRFEVLDLGLQPIIPTFFTTLPEKCGFGEGEVYCFIPRDNLAEIEDFADSYYKKQAYTTDYLFTFGTNDLGENTIFTSGAGDIPQIDGVRPYFANGAYTFRNRLDGYVYRYQL